MLERIIRDWGHQPRHALRRRSITIQDRSGADISGFIVALGEETFSFECRDGQLREIGYGDVSAISFDRPRPMRALRAKPRESGRRRFTRRALRSRTHPQRP